MDRIVNSVKSFHHPILAGTFINNQPAMGHNSSATLHLKVAESPVVSCNELCVLCNM